MTETKKDGLFKRLFGGKKTGCCDIKIEEVQSQPLLPGAVRLITVRHHRGDLKS
jgi:hypothetical protein